MLRRLFGLRPGGLYQRGIAAYNGGQLEQALAAFEDLLDRESDGSRPEVALARFYRAQAHARLGTRCLGEDDAEAALAHFDAALVDHPGYPDRHLRRGVALLLLDDALAAESAARRALEGNEAFAEAGALLVLSLQAQGQSKRAESERTSWWRKAESLGQAARGLFEPGGLTPDTLREHLLAEQRRRERIARADGLVLQGFWRDGRAAFEELVKEAPDYADIRLRLATVLALLGEYADAGLHLDAALDRNPGFVDALLGAGTVALLRGDPLGARQHLERAREVGEPDEGVEFGLLLVLLLEGDFEGALAGLQQLDWRGDETALLVALLRSAVGRPGEALRGLDSMPSRGLGVEALLDILACALHASDLDLARRTIEALPPGAPTAATAVGRAEFLLRSRQPERAVDVLDAATAEHPSSPALLWLLARMSAERGELDVALRRLSNLDALDARVPGAEALSANLLRRRGQAEAALAALDQETADADPAAALERLLCLRALGRTADARALVEHWLSLSPLDPVWRLQACDRWARPLLPRAHEVRTLPARS